MAIDILNVKPHVVSRDLTGYSILLYGEPKTGKTTISSMFPNSLLLGFEKGYSAIPGIMAQPINTWGEFMQVIRQLKKDEVKEVYKNIIIDTADIAWDYCQKYILDNQGVDKVSDVPYGQGYGMIEKEFDTEVRKIVQYGYGLILISHDQDKTFTSEQGEEYNKIVPSLEKRALKVVSRLTDIIGYVRNLENRETGETKVKMFLRGTPRYMAGSRFKYMISSIDMGYENLVNALHDAIEEEAKANNNKFISDDKNEAHKDTSTELDFDALMEEFNSLIEEFAKDEEKMSTYYTPRIQEIIERYIGKGNKVTNMSRTQTEALDLIVADLKELD